jgi:hypothetical protein
MHQEGLVVGGHSMQSSVDLQQLIEETKEVLKDHRKVIEAQHESANAILQE